jgi:hypothetical protein
MAASYPTSVKTFATRNPGQTIASAHVNDLQDEVNAIESGLLTGTAPLASSNSTVANLSVAGGSTIVGGINVGGNSTIAAALSVTGNSTIGGGLQVGGSAGVAGNFGVVGFSTFGSRVHINGGLFYGLQNIVLADGDNNDITINSTATLITLNGNSSLSTLNGFSGGSEGRVLTVVVGTANIALNSNNAGSSVGNRFLLSSAASTVIAPNAYTVVYTGTSWFWSKQG